MTRNTGWKDHLVVEVRARGSGRDLQVTDHSLSHLQHRPLMVHGEMADATVLPDPVAAEHVDLQPPTQQEWCHLPSWAQHHQIQLQLSTPERGEAPDQPDGNFHGNTGMPSAED